MQRASFRLTDALVSTSVIAVLVCLLMPSVQHARDDARLIECGNNVRRLVLATLNKESATQRFPLALKGGAVKINTDGPIPMSKEDGYSWTTQLLPYMEEAKLYDELSIASEQFRQPFNSDVFKRDGQLVHDVRVKGLLCPTADSHTLETRDKEYKMLKTASVSNYAAVVAGAVSGKKLAFDCISPSVGGMIVPQSVSPKGLKIGDCKDGTSKTFVFADTKAKRHNYWMSGRGTSTVAMPPDVITSKDILKNRKVDGFPQPPDGTPTAINYGRNTDGKADEKWFAAKYPPSEVDWGISSNHEDGKVVHGFVDGHVVTITKDVNSGAYFRAATRAGAEPSTFRDHVEPIPRRKAPRVRQESPNTKDARIKELEEDVSQLKAAVINLHKRVKELEGR